MDDALVGGAGRFLIFQLRALQKLVVLDVSEGKIAGFVSLESPQDIFSRWHGETRRRQSAEPRCQALCAGRPEAGGRASRSPATSRLWPSPWERPRAGRCSSSATTISTTRFSPSIQWTFRLSEYDMPIGAAQTQVVEMLNENLHLDAPATARCSAAGATADMAADPRPLHVRKSNGLLHEQIFGSYACPDDFGERIYRPGACRRPQGADRQGRSAARHNREFLPFRPSEVRCAIWPPLAISRSTGKRRAGKCPDHYQAGDFHVRGGRIDTGHEPAAGRFSPPGQSARNRKRGDAEFLCRRLFFIPAAKVIVEIPEALTPWSCTI